MPAELVAAADREGRRGWLHTLPATLRHLEARWSVEIDAPFQPGGQTAWVAPARRGGQDLVVKVLWRHAEAEHEADGLAAWHGNGAVRLHAATVIDDATSALLLERCRPGSTLAGLPEPEQDLILARLLPRLWIAPPAEHPFRPLAQMCQLWAAEFEQKTAHAGTGLDPGLAREGMTLFGELPASAERQVQLASDLHAENGWRRIRHAGAVGKPRSHEAVREIVDGRGGAAHQLRLADALGERGGGLVVVEHPPVVSVDDAHVVPGAAEPLGRIADPRPQAEYRMKHSDLCHARDSPTPDHHR
jgi:streptomycin 6-kinase